MNTATTGIIIWLFFLCAWLTHVIVSIQREEMLLSQQRQLQMLRWSTDSR